MLSPTEIVINVNAHESRVAVLEGEQLQELYVQRTAARGLVGNIYKGKVVRVVPGMQAAFVDIGLAKNGFLHLADLLHADSGQAAQSIQDVLHEGQTILVQVRKDAIGEKGVRLGTEITLPSRNLVYLPYTQAGGKPLESVAVSNKISDSAQRQDMRASLAEQLTDMKMSGSVIVRTLAECSSDNEISADLNYLQELWQNLQDTSKQAKAPALVHQDLALELRVLRDLVKPTTSKVTIDSEKAFLRAQQFAAQFAPTVVERLERYSAQQPVFDRYDIEPAIEQALQRAVALPSGGQLVIDQAEAMTVIDVNTASFTGQHDQQTTILQTNLEAVEALAKQLRLRNLGGIVLIDFIDMQSNTHKSQLMGALRTALAKDPTKTTVGEISALGLVELTRKRTHESLAQALCQTCPVCDGSGSIKTSQTVSYQILRELAAQASQSSSSRFTIVASAQVVDSLQHLSTALSELQNSLQIEVKLRVDSLYQQQQYDIALS